MHVAAGFVSSAYVEISIERIKGLPFVSEENITFVEMKPQEKRNTLFDSINHSDGSSSMDGIGVGAVVGGVFGIIYGSRLWLGSLMVGLLAFICGGLIGFIVDKMMGRRWNSSQRIKHIDILLLIRCETMEQAEKIMDICRSNQAVSLGIHS